MLSKSVDVQVMFWVLLLGAATVTSAQTAIKDDAQPLDAIATHILRSNGVPGGVEIIRGCGAPKPKAFAASGTTPEQALHSLMRNQEGLTWAKRGKAFTVTIRTDVSASIGSVDLPEAQLTVRTLSEATDILLYQDATRRELAKLKMAEAPTNLGFSSIRERETRTIFIPAGTLRDQLNTLAINFGQAVWRLEQRECGAARSFRLSWVVK